MLGSYLIFFLVGFIYSLCLAPAPFAVTDARCIHPPAAAMAQLAVHAVLNLGIALGPTLLVSNFILRRPCPYQALEPAFRLAPNPGLTSEKAEVVGIATQSDMLAALYKRLAMPEAVPRT